MCFCFFLLHVANQGDSNMVQDVFPGEAALVDLTTHAHKGALLLHLVDLDLAQDFASRTTGPGADARGVIVKQQVPSLLSAQPFPALPLAALKFEHNGEAVLLSGRKLVRHIIFSFVACF